MQTQFRRRELTELIPLRFGTYRGRYLAGLALIISGSVAIQGGNSYALFLIVQGAAAFVAGWILLPATGGRRLAVVVPALIPAFLQLAGPQYAPGMVVVLAAWLVVRQRRRLSFIALVPALVVTVALSNSFDEVTEMPFTSTVTAAAVVGSAWLAWRLDRRFGDSGTGHPPAPNGTTEIARSVRSEHTNTA
jgi:hypothetical protein